LVIFGIEFNVTRMYIPSLSSNLPLSEIKVFVTSGLSVRRKCGLTSTSNYLYYPVMRIIINVIVVSFVLS